MEVKVLGRSGLMVSTLGFGAWAIGGTDWGPVDDEESSEAIVTALGEGITLFDTADFYGFGHSETVVGRTLATHRKEVVIATKGGLRWDGAGDNVRRDASPHWLKAACEASLRRLHTDYIDLYQLHWPDPNVPVAESVGTLQRLREEGKIRHVGVCNLSVAELQSALSTGPITSLQPQYNLLERGAEKELLPFCQDHGLGVLTYSPLAMGLLTGKYVQEQVFSEGDVRGWFPAFRGETFRKHLHTVDQLRPIASGQGKSLAQLAIQWVLSHPAVTSALVGARNPDQVRENARGAGWSITPAGLSRIRSLLERVDG